MDLNEVTQKLEATQERAKTLVEKLESAGPNEVAEIKALLNDEVKPQLETLTAAHEDARAKEETKALRSELTNLQSVIEDLRKPAGEFTIGSGKAVEDESTDPYARGGFYRDVRLANKGNSDARERLLAGYEGKGLNAEGKAMSEGTANQGGYLVRPQVERQLVLARESDNVLRGLCSVLNVTSNSIQLDQLGISTTAGWVAELAAKPETTSVSLASVTASVFTAAGLATVSNQLLADSDPAVDQLVTADLAKRIVAVEETGFLSGSGTGQPLGILNTPGIGSTALTLTTIPDLVNAILDAIAAVETNHGSPTAIVMHPRTWTRILKAQNASGVYYLGGSGQDTVQDITSARTGVRGPQKLLWGYPVVTSNRVPTNLGAGTNESRVIVGDFREALILDREGITVDESEHVYFTTNQTVFRAEERVGFTAARTPLAFNVVGGAGLANG